MSLQIQNLTILKTCLFDDYLALPGLSYSTIKNDGVVFSGPTKKMQLGTAVHNYLLDPAVFEHPNLALVKRIAVMLHTKLGAVLMGALLPELAFTADMVCNSMCMPYKGRADLAIPGRIIVDIKVSEMPLKKAIEHFRYDRQLSGYAIALRAKVAIIVSIHPKTLQITMANISIESSWWEYQVAKNGVPLL